ncbi:hypothetical protein Dimus_006075 [Dionaea muscipula]
MVSFQSPFSSSKDQRNLISLLEESSSSTNKKRRRVDDDLSTEAEEILDNHRRKPKSFSDLGLHLDSPLPSEWQRFLDIQSGQIHFYNTKTHKRTLKDPRESEVVEVESWSPLGKMSLDLELNLPCGPRNNSSMETESNNQLIKKKRESGGTKPQISSGIFFMKKDFGDKGGSPSLSLSSSLEADDQQQQEMVATVCTQCHMLVMLCKSSPACPNCKFMHPPDHTPPNLFKPKLSVLCFHN